MDYPLTRLKDPEVFSYLKSKYASWSEIFQGFSHYDNYKINKVTKSLYSKKAMEQLEALGLDYNYVDTTGNNLLHYALQRGTKSERDGFIFYSEVYDYIYKKTNDVYCLNGAGKNILVHYLSDFKGGQEGINFFETLQKFPKLDIHLVGKDGRNILHDAILNDAPPEITQYLIKNKVSIHQENKDKYNLLSYFSTLGFNKNNQELFSELIYELDITHQTVYGSNCITDWLEFIASDKTQVSSKMRASIWLDFAFERIKSKSFKYDEKIVSTLFDSLEKNEKSVKENLYVVDDKIRKKLISNYDAALVTLRAISLDLSLPSKEQSKRIKI